MVEPVLARGDGGQSARLRAQGGVCAPPPRRLRDVCEPKSGGARRSTRFCAAWTPAVPFWPEAGQTDCVAVLIFLNFHEPRQTSVHMAKLIFHIGHPKTGTTALQTVLSANSEFLLRHGVLYPTRCDPGYHKHGLALPWLTGSDNPMLLRRTGVDGAALLGVSRAYWEKLRDEVAANPHRLLVLSCESFFSVPRHGEFGARLGDVCDSVKVVAYLRSPAERALSQLNQNIRMLRPFRLPPAEYYRPVLQAYDEQGFDDLALNVFDRRLLRDGDIVSDFTAKYLPADMPRPVSEGVGRANDSISTEALVLMAELPERWNLAQHKADYQRRRKAEVILRRADAAVGGNRRPALRPEVRAALVARSVDLPWLRDEHGIVFPDVNYDSIGAKGFVDLASLHRVEDFCAVDSGRLAALRRMTEAPLAKVYGGRLRGWLTAVGLR